MRALCYFYQFWGLFIHCFSVPNSQKQWSTSFVPQTDTFSTFNNIPWLVSIDETCQGIILNQWWILSTIRCLTKLKYFTSDISKVINKGGISHGNKICLHPNFNPSDGKYPGKAVIGVIHLKIPIRRKEISLLQPYNIFRESCFHCVHRHCHVYQHQKHSKFENNMKKLSVTFLDISSCHHQHNYMPKRNNLCIWIHQKEDCWIQQGSPVLCTFGNQWELVGLIGETSMTCDNPILVIKTAPYLSWMRRFIKMNEKPLDPIFSPLCSVYSGGEDLSNNISHADFSSLGFSLQLWNRLITSSRIRQRRNPPPVFFVSNNKDSFPDSRQLYFQGAHLSSGSKFPMVQLWATPIFKVLGTSKSALSCNNQISSDFECIIHSEAQIPQIAYISSRFPQTNALKYENGIIASSLRYWADLLDAKNIFHTISLNTVQSLIPFSKRIDGLQGASEIFSFQSKIKPSAFLPLQQFLLGSWMEITPNIRSWIKKHTMSFETETAMWNPFHRKITHTQIYYIVEKIKPSTYLGTYMLNPWASLLVSKIEMLTMITLHSSTFLNPYSWPLSTSIAFMSWSYYKPSKVIHSSQVATDSLLSRHKVTIVKSSKQTEDTAWPLFHSNIIKSLIYSKIDNIEPWTQSDSDVLKLRALSETESEKYLHTRKADHSLLKTQSAFNTFQLFTYFEGDLSSPWPESIGNIGYWKKTEPFLVMPWVHSEGQKTIHQTKPEENNVVWFQEQTRRIWRQSESPINHYLSKMKDKKLLPLYQSQGDTFKTWIHTKLQIMPSWTKHEHDNARLWTQIQETSDKLSSHNEMKTVLQWTEPITQSTHKRNLSETETGRLWKLPIIDKLRNWVYHEAHTVSSLNMLNNGIIKPRVHKEASTLTQWMQVESAKVNAHTPADTDKVIVWTQAETPLENEWLDLLEDIATKRIVYKNDIVTRWTQTEAPPSPWIFSEMDTFTPWSPSGSLNLISLVDPIIYSMPSWTQNEPAKKSTSLGKKLLRNKPMSWPKAESKERSNLALSESYSNLLLTKAHYPKVNTSVEFKSKRETIWASKEYPTLNLWKQFEIDIMTQFASIASPLKTSWSHQVSDTTNFNHVNSPSIIHLTNPNCDVTTWCQTKTQSVNLWNLPGKKSLISWTQYKASENNYWSESKPYQDNLKIQTAFYRESPWTHAEAISELTPANTETVNTGTQTTNYYKRTRTFKEITTDVFKPVIQTESPTKNQWMHHVSDKITIWTQPIYPTGSQWADIAPTARVCCIHRFTNGELLCNHTDRSTLLWPQAVSPPLNLQQQSVSYTVISQLLQDKYTQVSLWTKLASDIIRVPWPLGELSNQKTQSLSDTKIASWPEPELTPEYLWIMPVSNSHITQWPQDVSPKINISLLLISYTHLIPTPQWLLEQTLETNLRIPIASEKITAVSQSEYPTTNMLILSISSKVTLTWPQSKSLPVFLWGWSISHTMILSLTQNTRNQWSQLLSDAITPSWSLDNSPETKMWRQLISDAFIPSRIQAPSSKVNLFGLLISDTIILPLSQSIHSPVYRERLSGIDKFAPLWTKAKFSPEYIRASYISDISLPHWSKEEFSEVNQWSWSFQDTVTPTWTQVESPKLSISALIKPLPNTVTPMWTHSGTLPVYLWTRLLSDTITSTLPLPEPLPAKLWTLPIFNRTKPAWLEMESKNINTQPLSKHQTLIPWTGKIANVLSQWTNSEVLIVNYLTPSAYDTTQNHAQTPEVKHWTHLISDPVLLRNQATSVTTYFWKKYGANIFTEWADSQFTNEKQPTQPTSNILKHAEILTSDPWTKVKTDISQMPKENSKILNLWMQVLENTVTSSFQDVSLKPIPWTKIQSNTIRIGIQSETSVLTHWQQSISERVKTWFQTLLGVENPAFEKLWKFADTMVLKSWNQSATDIDSEWISETSTAIHVFTTPIFDKILHTLSPLLSQWTQTEADAVLWWEPDYFKKYFQTNSHHKIVRTWGLSEFSDEMALAAPESGTYKVWQQDISKYFIPRIDHMTKEMNDKIQTKSSKINYFAKFVANTQITQTQSNSLPINVDTQHPFDKVRFRIQTKYILTNSWIQEDNTEVNTKIVSEIHQMQPATETFELCIYTLYSTFNSLLHTEKLVTRWSQVEPQKIKKPLEKAKLSNILQFTQNDFLSVYPCINDKIYKFIPLTQAQYIPQYHWAESTNSKVVPWSNTDLFLANSWREGTISKLIYWNQFDSLSVNPSIMNTASIVIPWTRKESPPEDTWIGFSSPNVTHWIQEESSLEHSDTVSSSSTITPWIQPEHTPAVLWSQHMDLRYPLINKWMLPSDVITPTSSSETPTPLTLDESQLKNQWAQYVSGKPISWTKVLSISEKLWREGIFSTFLPSAKFTFPSEITSIHSTYDAITPWARAKISAVITCILSDYHVCISWNHNEFSKFKLKPTSSIVNQNFQSESPLDLLEPKVISIFTTWKLDELPSVQTDLKIMNSTTIALTKTESLENKPWSEVLTSSDISLNSTEFTPVQFYVHTGTDKSIFLTATESDEKNFLTESNINIFRNSMQAQTFSTQHSTQTEQTSFPWDSTETIDRNTWSFSEVGSLLSWKVPHLLADGHSAHHEYHTSRNWFKTKVEIRPWTHTYFQTISNHKSLRANKVESWVKQNTVIKSSMNSATGVFNDWTKSATKSLRLGNISKNSTPRPWFQVELNTDHSWYQLVTNTIRDLPLAESQGTRLWTQYVSDKLLPQAEIETEKYLYMSDNSAVSSWFPIRSSLSQRIKLEPESVTPWIQQEWQIAHPWDKLEKKVPKAGYNFEADTPQILLTYSKSDEINPWTYPESPLVRRWPEEAIVALWPLTKRDKIIPWSQLDYKTTQFLAQANFGRINNWIQHKDTMETLEIIPWTHSDIVLLHSFQTQTDSTLWSLTQNDGIMQWSQMEYETTLSLEQPNIDIINPLIQQEYPTETLEIIPWINSDTVLSYSFQTQIDSTLWSLTQNYITTEWSQVKYESTLSLLHSNVGINNPLIQHKSSIDTLEIIPWTHSDTVLTQSFQTQTDSSFWDLNQNDEIMQWSQMEYETSLSLEQPNIGIINPWIQQKDSTETLEIVPLTYSDTVSSQSFQIQIDSTLLPLTQNYEIMEWSQFEYETTQSLMYPNVDIINPWIQHTNSTETLEIIPWTDSHKLISYSLQTQIDSVRIWKQPQPMMTAQVWSTTLEQVVKTQALTTVGTVSPSFQVEEMLLNREPPLMPPSQFEPQDKHSPEPLSLRQSKLNVSLAECHLSMTWKENLQALWLYKTAVVSHDTTECGSRPGLVPHCPNCWEAEIGEFPWMVSVQLSYSHFCAGSILNEKWILTSARCANFIKRSESLALVQVGLVDLQDPTQGETVGIHRSMPYLGPRGPLGPGLIFLKEPLHFQPLVLPICLEENQEQERHIQLYDCWLPSWSLMRGSPGILQKRHLSILQVSTCSKFWPQLNEFTFCVEAKKAMGESGCKGDLGAPLVCRLKQKDTWVQVGILIHFDEHCKKPYVFSQVSPFIFWLQRVTQPSHAPWIHQRPVTHSPFKFLAFSTNSEVSTFTSPTAVIHPHFISLPHPQAFADHISLQYTMPWQALIFSCGNQICSGSIISSYWVLTAAHCVRNMNPEDTIVILGLRHPGTPLRVVKVSTILLHERFRLVTQAARNDLALVLLQESQSSFHVVAPLGNMKNLNTSECWLSGPQILRQGDILENPEMLQIQVMGASNCAYLYPDIGSSTVCYIAQARGPEINMESVSPGSAVMCRPLSGNGKWRQIGFTSLKHLATIVSPHFSWIFSTTAKAGYPLNQALTAWIENLKSSSLVKCPTTLLLSTVVAIAMRRVFIL